MTMILICVVCFIFCASSIFTALTERRERDKRDAIIVELLNRLGQREIDIEVSDQSEPFSTPECLGFQSGRVVVINKRTESAK